MATLKNTSINDTGFLKLPVGTNAERPASPITGYLRYNTTRSVVEIYLNSSWKQISFSEIVDNIEYLVVAGGSAGSNGNGSIGQGGLGGGPGSVGSSGAIGTVILKYQDFLTITVGVGLTSTTTGPSGGYKITTLTSGTGLISFN
jgi:hypothetical protein